MHSATEIGELFAEADGGSPEDAAYISRQVRNWQNLGFLVPEDRAGRGPKAAALFSSEAFFKARIFATLSELGFDAGRIRQVNEELRRTVPAPYDDKPASFKVNGGYSSAGVVADALRGIRAGERWCYEIRLVRRPDGRKTVESSVVWPDFPQESESDLLTLAKEVRLVGFKQNKPVLATVLLDLNALFAPLITVATD